MTDYVDQAVQQIQREGIALRRRRSDGDGHPVGELDDGTTVVRVESGRELARERLSAYLQCLLAGHQYEGRRMVHWDDEETPAIECTRCRLIRARLPTGKHLA